MGKKEYLEAIDIIQNNKFWIYGYGKLSKRLYTQVINRGFIENLAGFIVTDLSSINKCFCEKPIVSIDEVDRNEWIIIAADTTSTMDINYKLIKYEFKNIHIGLYSLFDLEAGPPIESGKKILAKKFFNDTSNGWIEAVYLAAKQYDCKEVSGKDIYIKLLSGRLGREMAERDYKRFMHTVGLCEKEGFIQDFPIKICRDLYVLDGAHRIVLSQCFGDGNILADVYGVNRDEWVRNVLKRSIRLVNDDVLLKLITENELKTLKEVSIKINR